MHSFQEWCGEGGARYELWARDSALGSVSPPTLTVVFPSAFTRKAAQELVRDERVLTGAARFFPGCDRVEIRLRDDTNHNETRREQMTKERAKYLEALSAEMREDPLVVLLQKRFDGEVGAITPPDDPPRVLGTEVER